MNHVDAVYRQIEGLKNFGTKQRSIQDDLLQCVHRDTEMNRPSFLSTDDIPKDNLRKFLSKHIRKTIQPDTILNFQVNQQQCACSKLLGKRKEAFGEITNRKRKKNEKAIMNMHLRRIVMANAIKLQTGNKKQESSILSILAIRFFSLFCKYPCN